MTTNKDEIKFVYNFHCAGNLFILPYNGELPNSLYQQNPEIKQIFSEIVEDSTFADNMKIGPSTEVMGMAAGGDAGDWINYALGIPAAESELGAWAEY